MARAVKKPSTSLTQGVELPKFDLQLIQIRLIGDAPLICHAWSAKAKKEMLDKQTKVAKAPRAAKDPLQDFYDSLYAFPGGGYGFPAIGIKSCAVDACSHVSDITKVEARGAFHIQADLLKIESGEPTMREDMVRVGMGTADIRYRGQFIEWAIDVPIQFNAGVLSAGQITNLFNIGGFSIGLGEWRPQRDGMFGRFHVAREGE